MELKKNSNIFFNSGGKVFEKISIVRKKTFLIFYAIDYFSGQINCFNLIKKCTT
jgi:hypothetical protein